MYKKQKTHLNKFNIEVSFFIYINTNFNTKTIPTTTVVQLISFHLPVNNFNNMYDRTPNNIQSEIE